MSVVSCSTAAVTGAMMHRSFRRPVVTPLFIHFNLHYPIQPSEWSEPLTDAGFLWDKAVVSRDTIKWTSFSSLVSFLGAFPELRKSLISFVMFACPYAWNNSAPTGRIFVKFHTLLFFENLSRKFKFHQNLTRMTDLLREDQYTSTSVVSHSILCRMRKASDWAYKEICSFGELRCWRGHK
jgi:hypothetical protein